jgi:hypothetical protein
MNRLVVGSYLAELGDLIDGRPSSERRAALLGKTSITGTDFFPDI